MNTKRPNAKDLASTPEMERTSLEQALADADRLLQGYAEDYQRMAE